MPKKQTQKSKQKVDHSNVRAFHSHQQTRFLMSRVVDALVSGDDFFNITQLITREVQQWLNAHACFFIPNQGNAFENQFYCHSLSYNHLYGVTQNNLTDLDRPNSQATILLKGTPEVTSYPIIQDYMTHYQLESLIVVPVMHNDQQQFGLLLIEETAVNRRWSRQETEALEMVASHLAGAFYLHKLRVHLEENYEREKLLKNVIQVVSQSFDIHAILREVAQISGEYFDADRCLVLRYDAETPDQPIRFFEQYTFSEKLPAIAQDDLPVSAIRSSVESTIIDSDRMMSQNDMAPFMAKYQVDHYLPVQVTYRGRPYGLILLLYNYPQPDWQEKDIKTLQDIATQTGVALYQSELYQKEQRARKTIQTIHDQKSLHLANLTHELRSPLNTMVAGTALLSEQLIGPLNDKQQQYTKLIEKNSQHLLLMINELLDFSKIESGKFSIKKHPVDPQSLVKQSAEMMQPLFDQNSQHITVTLAETLPETISCDPVRMKQVLCNLLANAAKFSKENGTISLSAKANNEHVIFMVKDNGIGIAPDELDTIFEPFEQGKQPNPEVGTGLGLPIASSIVKQHGGHINVQSKPGKGSTFTVKLPLHF